MMIKRYRSLLMVMALVATLLAGCSNSEPTSDPTTERMQVTVSIVPQQYFVERIGGEHVEVNVMVLPGANPATYEPKPDQLTALSQSRAYFSIGVPFEKVWLERFASANEDMLVVDTAAGITRLPMATEHHHEGEEGEEGGTEIENPDPHIWLSPDLVKVQAQNIHDALVRLDPEHAKDYGQNLASFLADIETLDTEIRETLSDLDNRKFIVFHPSWGYFAQDYDLEMLPIEVGGQEPSAAELVALIEETRKENIRVIFAQPEFSTRAAETLADEIEGEVLLISPLAYEWMENLRQVADTFARVLDE
ncbi:MAG: metal ABC transporter solute-binding protein, Zn/Mn family [Anaerolineae bacterium]